MKSTSASSAYIVPGIIILTLATALIHFSLSIIMGKFDLVFTLNGLGYLALLVALLADIPYARENRKLVRYAFIGFTAVSILAWVLIGDKTWWLGWFDKVIELALIGLLIIKRP